MFIMFTVNWRWTVYLLWMKNTHSSSSSYYVIITTQTKMALIFLHHVILTVAFCSMTSHATVSRTFKLQVNATDSTVCAVDKPSTVVPMAASTMAGQCGTMCNVDPYCELFQFKEDLAQCELFDYWPSNFSSIDHCASYAAPPTGTHKDSCFCLSMWINLKNLKFTLNVRTIITLRKQQKLFLHDFVAISAR